MTTETESSAGIASYLAARRKDVDAALERLLPGPDAWPANLHRAIRHSVFAGGKRLRPILCLAAGEVFRGRTDELLEPACGLEMIHTYSLIHDDLPALDNDDLRRGVPTCHVVFGEATAILAGDSLLTHGLGLFALYPRAERFAAAKVRVLQTVVEAIGTAGHDRRAGRGPGGGEGGVAHGRARREDPREQDGPADSRVAAGGRDPGGRRRGGARPRSTTTAARSASPFRSRTTCSTSSRTRRRSARRRGRTRRTARPRSRASGASSARASFWRRTWRRRSRPRRRCRVAGESCPSSRASWDPARRDRWKTFPGRRCILFTPGDGSALW